MDPRSPIKGTAMSKNKLLPKKHRSSATLKPLIGRVTYNGVQVITCATSVARRSTGADAPVCESAPRAASRGGGVSTGSLFFHRGRGYPPEVFPKSEWRNAQKKISAVAAQTRRSAAKTPFSAASAALQSRPLARMPFPARRIGPRSINRQPATRAPPAGSASVAAGAPL